MSNGYGKSTTASAIKSTSGLVGYYTGESWTGNQWTDLSGIGNHVTTIGGTITKKTSGLNGKATLSGNQSTTMIFPAAILPPIYTIIHITRYTNTATKQRIWNGYDQNWLSGHHMGRAGVAHHNGWIADSNVLPDMAWVLSTDQNALYRSNKVDRTTGSPGSISYANLSINISRYYSEQSDFETACLVVYNRGLTLNEMQAIENELATTYALGF